MRQLNDAASVRGRFFCLITDEGESPHLPGKRGTVSRVRDRSRRTDDTGHTEWTQGRQGRYN